MRSKFSVILSVSAACMICVLLLFPPDAAAAMRSPGYSVPGLDEVILEWEAGPLYIFRNDGRYGENGTKYKAGDVGQQRNLLFSRRITLETAFLEKHRLIFSYIPLDLTTSVRLDKDIKFRDTLFPSGTLVEHRYLFDGYRISYLYRTLERGKYDLDLGGTLQIRNAEVSFRQADGPLYETENDIGMVFAAKCRVSYYPCGGGLRFIFEADAFSTFGLLGDSVKGAIYDLRLGMGFPVSRSADLVFSARLLGGGAEVERRDIENWGDYGSLTAALRFNLPSFFSK